MPVTCHITVDGVVSEGFRRYENHEVPLWSSITLIRIERDKNTASLVTLSTAQLVQRGKNTLRRYFDRGLCELKRGIEQAHALFIYNIFLKYDVFFWILKHSQNLVCHARIWKSWRWSCEAHLESRWFRETSLWHDIYNLIIDLLYPFRPQKRGLYIVKKEAETLDL